MTAQSDSFLVLQLLTNRGAMTSHEIKDAINKSQPTVSRILSALDDEIVAIGKASRTRYAMPQPIGVEAAQQPIWLIDETGNPAKIGTLSFLLNNQIAIEAEGFVEIFRSELPWFLAPIKAQGFLGRLLAQQIRLGNVDANPEKWNLETVLYASLHLHDTSGAIRIGYGGKSSQAPIPVIKSAGPSGPVLFESLDEVTADIAKTLPAGSSAGGEQPKFLALTEQGEHILVKFSPPRGSPIGDRWTDLLYAEKISADVLARHGIAAAKTQIVRGKERSYLLSTRFDRIGRTGRLHVVPVGEAHKAFVPGPYANWASTCDALTRQGKLSAEDSQKSDFLLQFGRLIGNSDMHSGNLSLFVRGKTLPEITKGAFALTPCYDMLPMRWRPDAFNGLHEYTPFNIDEFITTRAVRAAAAEFWSTLSLHEHVSKDLRAVAAEMATRIGEDLPHAITSSPPAASPHKTKKRSP